MRKLILLSPLFLLLGGCSEHDQRDQDDSISAVNANLPAGCTLHFAGDVVTSGSRFYTHIFYTQCPAHPTSTVSTQTTVQNGKYQDSVNGVNAQILPESSNSQD